MLAVDEDVVNIEAHALVDDLPASGLDGFNVSSDLGPVDGAVLNIRLQPLSGHLGGNAHPSSANVSVDGFAGYVDDTQSRRGVLLAEVFGVSVAAAEGLHVVIPFPPVADKPSQ